MLRWLGRPIPSFSNPIVISALPDLPALPSPASDTLNWLTGSGTRHSQQQVNVGRCVDVTVLHLSIWTTMHPWFDPLAPLTGGGEELQSTD